MYLARGNQVFYINPVLEKEELFVTVHQTESSISLEDQAETMAKIFNEMPVD